MHKLAVALATVMMLLPAAPAGAAADARPTVKNLGIVGVHTSPEGWTEYTLAFEVVDPDGFVVELIVDLGDGVTASLLLLCDPATIPRGARQTIETVWSYQPGRYTVRAVAYSVSDCDGGSLQRSAPSVRSVVAS